MLRIRPVLDIPNVNREISSIERSSSLDSTRTCTCYGPWKSRLTAYLGASAVTQVGAARRMNCLSAASFQVFLNRVRNRIESWITRLVQLIHDLEGQVPGADVSYEPPKAPGAPAVQWQWFIDLVDTYFRLYARIPAAAVVPEPFRRNYIYSLLSRHHMGLGP